MCMPLKTISIPKGAIMSAILPRLAVDFNISIPKGAIMSYNSNYLSVVGAIFQFQKVRL